MVEEGEGAGDVRGWRGGEGIGAFEGSTAREEERLSKRPPLASRRSNSSAADMARRGERRSTPTGKMGKAIDLARVGRREGRVVGEDRDRGAVLLDGLAGAAVAVDVVVLATLLGDPAACLDLTIVVVVIGEGSLVVVVVDVRGTSVATATATKEGFPVGNSVVLGGSAVVALVTRGTLVVVVVAAIRGTSVAGAAAIKEGSAVGIIAALGGSVVVVVVAGGTLVGVVAIVPPEATVVVIVTVAIEGCPDPIDDIGG